MKNKHIVLWILNLLLLRLIFHSLNWDIVKYKIWRKLGFVHYSTRRFSTLSTRMVTKVCRDIEVGQFPKKIRLTKAMRNNKENVKLSKCSFFLIWDSVYPQNSWVRYLLISDGIAFLNFFFSFEIYSQKLIIPTNLPAL